MNTTEKITAAVQEEIQDTHIIPDAAAVAPAPSNDGKPREAAEPESYVRFHKPYLFEGNSYAGIDLKAIEGLTAKDMCDAEKYLSRIGIISPLPEMTMEYIAFVSNRAIGQPIEFFMGLPPKDATKVKNKVTSFFYGED